MPPETMVLIDEDRDGKPHGGRTMKFTFQPESKPLEGYTIKRAIHRGGFGEVYYALSDAGKEVALKLLKQHLDVELRGVTQCLNLKHPNLVTIFDIRTDADGDHWVVMEYVSGKSLNHVLEQFPHGMPMDDVEHWLAGMADGLNFLHDRGIVHRDLKPANIFSEHGVVKIGDVGLSKFISESHRSAQTQSVGTVYYMAPEVAHGRYGREVDIYSLGVMLYELITGRVPFVGESAGEILMKHLSERPDLSPIPARLRAVVARALEKDPLRRTPSAAELLEDFRKALRGFDIPRDIPEESFIGHTVPDSSAARRDVPPPLPREFGLKDQIARDAKEVARHAKAAAQQAQKWAQEIQHAARDARHHRRGAPHEQGRHATPPGQAAPAPNGTYPHGRLADRHTTHEPLWHSPAGTGFWLAMIGGCVLFVFALRGGLFSVVDSGVRIGILILMLYFIFRLIRYATTPSPRVPVGTPHGHAPPPAQPVYAAGAAHPVMPQAARVMPPPPKPKRQVMLTPNTPRALSWHYRVSELTASLALASLCTALITVGLASFPSLMNSPEQIGLFAATTLLASWGILTLSKLMEGVEVDAGTRRIMFLGLGLLVGLSAFYLDNALLPGGTLGGMPSSFTTSGAGKFGDYMFHSFGPYQLIENLRFSGAPSLAGYLVFFGGLLALRRWWWHCDSFRPGRFRAMSLLGTSMLALALVTVWAFPQWWGVMWAATISSVVQLAAAWVPPRDRAALMEGKPHA